MSIDDFVSKYKSEETNYNKYISELEEISKSKDDVSEKCNKLFESFRKQLEKIPPALTSGAPPSATQIKEVISFLKAELHRKTSQLAQQIVQSKIDLLNPEIYKIFPHPLRFEIAKFCAADDGFMDLSEMIKAYEITDQNDIYELVKIKVSVDPLHVCNHFKDYGITDEEKVFEVAKSIASGIYGGFLLDFYPSFNISNPNKAFELMKILAQKHSETLSTSSHLTIFLNTIKDPQKRYEIVCIVASQDLESLLNFIKKLQNLDQDQRFNLAQIAAQTYGIDVIKDLDQFGITDVNQIKMIYRLCYPGFNISDPNNAFELMKIIAQKHPEIATFSHLALLRDIIKDPQQRYEIVCIIASKNLDSLFNFIKELEIVEADKLFNLAQIAAQIHGVDVIDHFDQFGIKDVNQTKVIYRLCYEHAMKKFYLYEDTGSINSLSFPDHIQWGFSLSLRMWLDRAIALKVPLDFEMESEKAECEEKINGLLSDLITEGVAAGFSEGRLKSLLDKVILKADSLQQQMKYIVWLGDFLMRCGFEPSLKPLLEDEAAFPTFEEVFKLTNPILQVASTVALTETYKNEDKRKAWLSLLQGQPEHLLLTSLLLTSGGIQEKTSRKILESLKTKKYTDYKLMQSINEMICFLAEKSGLSVPYQDHLLEVVLNEPEKEPRERFPDYQKRVAEYRKTQEILLAAISAWILFGRSEMLEDIPNAKALVDKWNITAGEIFGIRGAEMIEKFNTAFCQSKRYPNALLIYVSRMQMLPDEEKLPINEALGEFTKAVLDGTFPQIRYEFTKNLHLETVFENNPSLLEKWKTPLPSKVQEELIVEDTDHWEDLLLLGTEVLDSCQHIMYKNPKFSKCLIAYLLDGKNRAMVVKNKQGKIIARSVLRILWDPQKQEPVLFMEKFYTSQKKNTILAQMVREGCVQKARDMGLTLVASVKDHPDLAAKPVYSGELESLGGPVPFEYVDAAGGIQLEGKFEIPESYVLFDPTA